jgi:hypothetical protein
VSQADRACGRVDKVMLRKADWFKWLPVASSILLLIIGSGVIWRISDILRRPDVVYEMIHISGLDPTSDWGTGETLLVLISNDGRAAATGLRINVRTWSKIINLWIVSPEAHSEPLFSRDSLQVVVEQQRVVEGITTLMFVTTLDSTGIEFQIPYDQGLAREKRPIRSRLPRASLLVGWVAAAAIGAGVTKLVGMAHRWRQRRKEKSQ